MPLDGEFILAAGAGFIVASDEDPTCGEGSQMNFGDVDHYEWLDPTLWQSAASIDELENGKVLFFVDAERVPCHHDDVIFESGTSFKVQVQEPSSALQLRSISILGHKFSSNAEFGEHLSSPTGRLQFTGTARPQITYTKCQDKTGCLCGNDGVQQEICSALLQHKRNKCAEVSCPHPLRPIGHCCDICGAILSLDYTSDFDLEGYRSRLIHTFLSLVKYSEVKLAVSKVQTTTSMKGETLIGSEMKIQIVCMNEKTGTSAQQLGHDILEDIQTHGQSFGITKAEIDFSTSTTTSTQKGSLSAGGIIGIVLGIILLMALLGLAYLLYRKDVFRVNVFMQNVSRLEETESVMEVGFSNPIFEPTTETEEDKPEEGFSPSEITFSNPAFDANVM